MNFHLGQLVRCNYRYAAANEFRPVYDTIYAIEHIDCEDQIKLKDRNGYWSPLNFESFIVFQKWQKVRCCETIISMGTPPQKGQFYVIKHYDNKSHTIQLVEMDGVWSASYFELMDRKPEPTPIKLNIEELTAPIERLDQPAQTAIPIQFRKDTERAFLAAAELAPPLQIRDWKESDKENQHIGIELEDMVRAVNCDEENAADAVMRLCMHIQDARHLTVSLIQAIAKSGDPIGQLLLKKLHEAQEFTKAAPNASHAICDIEQSFGSTQSYFSLSWNKTESSVGPIGRARDKHYFRIKGFSLESKDEIVSMLRIIRKYAELFNLLIDLTDHHGGLLRYPWKDIMEPYIFQPALREGSMGD